MCVSTHHTVHLKCIQLFFIQELIVYKLYINCSLYPNLKIYIYIKIITQNTMTNCFHCYWGLQQDIHTDLSQKAEKRFRRIEIEIKETFRSSFYKNFLPREPVVTWPPCPMRGITKALGHNLIRRGPLPACTPFWRCDSGWQLVLSEAQLSQVVRESSALEMFSWPHSFLF